MQTNNSFFKSFIPVKIYQSASSLYMTCISKMPRNANKPECDQSLVIEQALVSAVDSTLRPVDYERRQREAREILIKSQENLLQHLDPMDADSHLTDDDEDAQCGKPVRLKSKILLNEYQKRYETPPQTELEDMVPIKAIAQCSWFVLRLLILACSVFVLIYCGHYDYFL
ncbi:uncharacterized protein LOC6531047 isoform X1 [Drosophila yakuba]|uniref:Uncharacterized protein, isoform A n=2 Tax=Drosophila yakuba TaxID=7245 RepID=B4P4A9_DROYA|nr:uncharacterized protein LOC6531047 isoform X1 [Drosophila yakuba]EDW91595.1 uncharacterized protein Dyak_GE13894, isoform A [Drosophila yakuba]